MAENWDHDLSGQDLLLDRNTPDRFGVPLKLLAALTGFLSPYRDHAAKERATVS
jgi:hypothetical protein